MPAETRRNWMLQEICGVEGSVKRVINGERRVNARDNV